MSENESNKSPNVIQSTRVLIIGLVAVVLVLGLGLLVMILGRTAAPAAVSAAPERVNALENSEDECVVCHKRTTPGIVQQYGHST
ncbi:MAG: hypothetical protein OES12_07010, partial [Anaerolineae bacterium]|nr:hypothetical protein [Anaerolineae bacterium]